MVWKYGDPLTAEDMDACAAQFTKEGKPMFAEMARQHAASKRLGIWLWLLRDPRVWWSVGWTDTESSAGRRAA